MATITDVAREAGVSASTVSHVINRTRYVAPKTARRVAEAINRLGYAPSEVARALKTNRTYTIGMIIPSSTNPFFGEILRGVEDACFARGYSLILCNSDDRTEKLLHYLNTLKSKRIDGLLVITANTNPGAIDQLVAESGDLPKLLLDTAAHEGVGVVADNSLEGGRMAASFLIGRGFRHIGCIAGPAGHPRSEDRLAGFQARLAEEGIGLPPPLLRHAQLTIGAGQVAMDSLLATPTRPEAVFCCSDVLAIGALSAAYRRHVDVPTDISIMGYDDIEIAAYTAPPLCTMRQPAATIGGTAADMLIEQLEKAMDIPPMTTLQPQLIERQSVGWPRRGATE